MHRSLSRVQCRTRVWPRIEQQANVVEGDGLSCDGTAAIGCTEFVPGVSAPIDGKLRGLAGAAYVSAWLSRPVSANGGAYAA
jgi:hypothetical protein